jgi:hypothetical protein
VVDIAELVVLAVQELPHPSLDHRQQRLAAVEPVAVTAAQEDQEVLAAVHLVGLAMVMVRVHQEILDQEAVVAVT